MKVALLTEGIYPYDIGGMQKHSFALVKYFAKNKIYVDVYTKDTRQNREKLFELLDPVEIKYVRLKFSRFPEFVWFPGHYLVSSYLYSKRIYEQLLDHSDVDFVYVQGFAGWYLLNRKKTKRLPPVGINFHGLEMYQPAASFRSWLENVMFRPFVSYNLKNSDIVFSLGGNLNKIIEQLGIESDKIYNSPNGANVKLKNGSLVRVSDKRRFIFIGRYERRKGIEELHYCLNKLIQENANFSFHFIGPIPDRLRINASKIKYHGMLNNEGEVYSILETCDVLVSPSYSEGMPTVIFEAMAKGLAIIATNVGAVSSAVSDDNGWLVLPGNKDQLLQTLRAVISMPENELLEKRLNSRKLFERNHTWDRTISTTIESLRLAIGNGANSG